MRTEWHFRNDPTAKFRKTSVFSPNSTWEPPMDPPGVNVFLSRTEHETFKKFRVL